LATKIDLRCENTVDQERLVQDNRLGEWLQIYCSYDGGVVVDVDPEQKRESVEWEQAEFA
jgi:hypothetical protein